MAAKNQLSGISSAAKLTLSALGKKKPAKYPWDAADLSAAQDISAIPGVMDILKGDPALLQQVLKDPSGALDTYNEAIAAGDVSTPSAQVTSNLDIITPSVKSPSSVGLPEINLGESDSALDRQMSALDTLLVDLTEANEAQLRGEIPGDVTAAVRQGTAESSLTAGLFGPASVQLGVQQLGTTSLNIKQQGIENAKSIATLRGQSVQFAQNKRDFDYTYRLNTQQLMEDMRRTDLNYLQLAENQSQFNASQNLQLVGYIADLISNSAQVQTNLAINDVDGAGIAADFGALISQLDALLAAPQTR